MPTRLALLLPWLWALFCLSCGHSWAQNSPAVPMLTARVMDHTQTLTPEQQQSLEQKLAAFEQAKGTQVVVLIIPSTGQESIETYANRVASSWKIGRKDVGDGLLLLVAKNDHQLRIEVARALEGAITDLQASQVIQHIIVPRFKQGDFAGGIDQGVDAIIALINHEALPTPSETGSSNSFSLNLYLTIVLCGLTVAFVSLLIGTKGEFAPSLVLAIVITLLGFVGSGIGWLVLDGAVLGVYAGHPIVLVLSLLLFGWLAKQTSAGNRSVGQTVINSQGQTLGTILTPRPSAPAEEHPKPSRSTSNSDDDDTDSSTESSFDFSSGGGGSFGGGGASGRW